jgi:2-keto-4-pentenoate hydratase
MTQNLAPDTGNPAVHSGFRSLLNSISGERRLGWKIGINSPIVQSRLGLLGPVLGVLSESTLSKSGVLIATGQGVLVLEAELALKVGEDVPRTVDLPTAAHSVQALAPAFELLRIDGPLDIVEDVIAKNSYHAQFAVGEWVSPTCLKSMDDLTLSLRIAEEAERGLDPALVVGSPAEIVSFAARFLASVGERLRSGDMILCGCLNAPARVRAGQWIEASLDPVGAIAASISNV